MTIVLAAMTVATVGGCAMATPGTGGDGQTEPVASSQAPLQTTGWTYTLAYRGGGGGTWQSLSCGSGNVLVGLYGRSGSYVDQMGLICAQLHADGTLGPAFDPAWQWAGGWGGSADYPAQCPPNEYVRGVFGYAGQYLDYIAVLCSGSENFEADLGGGWGGNWFGDQNDTCPAGYAMTGFNVRAGSWLDGEQPVCDYLQP
jgi:hypothetical protein